MGDLSYYNDGMKIGGQDGAALVSSVDITTTGWLPVPASALARRNAIALQNNTSNNVYLAFANTSTSNWILGANREISLDVKPAITVYAKGSVAGQALIVMEISHKAG